MPMASSPVGPRPRRRGAPKRASGEIRGLLGEESGGRLHRNRAGFRGTIPYRRFAARIPAGAGRLVSARAVVGSGSGCHIKTWVKSMVSDQKLSTRTHATKTWTTDDEKGG